jgi:site-specific DNA-cytosine methylase
MPKIKIKPKQPLKAISLFSGMGGDSLGIMNAKLKLIAYSEKESLFRDTHKNNFPECELIGNGDITKTTNDEFIKYQGNCDLIFAGFPCQGFSNAGDLNLIDPRNTLFREFHRATKLIKPKYIIGENVKGLLTKYTITFESIIDFFKKYDITEFLEYIKTYNIETLYPNLYQVLVSKGKNVVESDIIKLLTEYDLLFTFIKIQSELKTNTNIIKKLYSELIKIICELKEKTKTNTKKKELYDELYELYDELTELKELTENTDLILSTYDKIINNTKITITKKNKKKINYLHKSIELNKTGIIHHRYIEDIYIKMKVSYINIIKKAFEDLDYSIYHKVLKAHEYNIPQKRERLIIVGIKNNINKTFTFPQPIENPTLNLKDIVTFNMTGALKIDNTDFDMESIPNECILTDLNNDEIENNPHPNLKLLAKSKDYNYKNVVYKSRLTFGKRIPVGGEIIDIRHPAKTIICTYGRLPRFFVPIKNKNGYFLRCLLPNELKQIQGFPKDFEVCGNDIDQITQIGNAVPPPLIEQIINNIIN